MKNPEKEGGERVGFSLEQWTPPAATLPASPATRRTPTPPTHARTRSPCHVKFKQVLAYLETATPSLKRDTDGWFSPLLFPAHRRRAHLRRPNSPSLLSPCSIALVARPASSRAHALSPILASHPAKAARTTVLRRGRFPLPPWSPAP